jgi:hypothetical protein
MKTTTITVKLGGLSAVHAAVDDIREALCAASSEGWDSFSKETRQEIDSAIEACDALLAIGATVGDFEMKA